MYNKEMILKEFGDFVKGIDDNFGQILFEFENKFGASLVNHRGSYGNEIAVIKWHDGKWDLTYSTDITDDVVGHLGDEEIIKTLKSIQTLDEDGKLNLTIIEK